MVAHGRPEDDEVRESGGAIRQPSEDMLRRVYIVSCGLDFEMTRYGGRETDKEVSCRAETRRGSRK